MVSFSRGIFGSASYFCTLSKHFCFFSQDSHFYQIPHFLSESKFMGGHQIYIIPSTKFVIGSKQEKPKIFSVL